MNKYAAILLSRQQFRPTGNTSWVRQAVAAVHWLQQQGMGLASSTGMQTWELITALASDLALPLRLYLPVSPARKFYQVCDDIANDFNLKLDRTEFVPVLPRQKENNQVIMAERDKMVIEQADLLLPISIRNSGNMADLIERAEQTGHRIDRRFEVTHTPRGEPLKLTLDGQRLSDEILRFEGDYIIHWTRATSQPWPDERKIDFYRAILDSDSWPRSGLDTLERIIRMKKILASSRNMPDATATVSFSTLSPGEVVPLMRWRARFGEMSFEPYGIGIERETAARIGIREVNYYDLGDKTSVAPADRWLRQSTGKVTDWRAEKEWRYLGEVLLEGFPADAVVLFCMTSHEADSLRRRYPYWVVSFLA